MNAYIDANIFVHASASKDALGESCVKILDWIAKGRITAVTSFLTFDEVSYKLEKLCGFEKSVMFTENFLAVPNLTFANVDSNVVQEAFKIIKKHKFHPRDAIHAATGLLCRADALISEDKSLLESPWLNSIDACAFVRHMEEL